MPSTIAVVGAGPGLGYSTARRFGAAGHAVALVARNRNRLESMAASLRENGIVAEAFPADVTDEAGLTTALHAAADGLGRIDVLSYAPGATWDFTAGEFPDPAALGYTSTLDTTPESARRQFELAVAGALTATRAVLPGMREAREGALLFTTGMSAVVPLPVMGNAGIALAGLRNWASALHGELADDGVYVGHTSIGLPIVRGSGDGDPDAIADRWYRLTTARDTFETTIGF
ncbi:SDR family NAD(P)-dependent oxidoreductase [Prescottella agglutinans]|uniref:SDR family NAD(P)-dependent oxidoreductase n=1 Tax=Prescottella agglutinans TaxID=1644129 RepID=A0A3S3E9Z2_9NOCA|nr:SDR family NAD(P)-dependent oxidoreductase [Prescottella agglutinans]RVW08773.1 SDR family NAD(P)-dependent oxidoreductase [Prescottella agglutinans]